MMSGFDDYAPHLYESIFSTLGKPATFHPDGGQDIELTVILKKDEEYAPPGQINYAKTRYIVSYRRKDIDRRVKKNETFTIEGTTYKVFSMSNYPDGWSTYRGDALTFPL